LAAGREIAAIFKKVRQEQEDALDKEHNIFKQQLKDRLIIQANKYGIPESDLQLNALIDDMLKKYTYIYDTYWTEPVQNDRHRFELNEIMKELTGEEKHNLKMHMRIEQHDLMRMMEGYRRDFTFELNDLKKQIDEKGKAAQQYFD
jgi:transcription elongation factor